MTREWRLQEAAAIAARVEKLRRSVVSLSDSLQSVNLLDAPTVVDQIVAQLRPIDVGRMATELSLATERIRQAVDAHGGDRAGGAPGEPPAEGKAGDAPTGVRGQPSAVEGPD